MELFGHQSVFDDLFKFSVEADTFLRGWFG
jgi:hypothetical protein